MHEVKRIMRKMNRFITALLVLLSAAGIGLTCMFFQHEQKLSTQRQEKMQMLSDGLQPINAQRKELQERDSEWQKTLNQEKEGKSCIILCFNTMNDDVYYTMFDMMEQYGFRGTFVLKNGNLPGYSEESVTGEEVSEMLSSGWEYALSENVDVQKETDEVLSFLKTDTEEETETITETAPEDTSEAENKSWTEMLDEHLATLEQSQMSGPLTLLCTEEQYGEISAAELQARNLKMVCVLNEDGFPVIEENTDGIRRLDGGLYTQKDLKLEESLDNAVSNHKSMVISINEVVKISENAGYDLSVTKFTSLLNRLKTLEEQGEIYVLTFSEYLQYEEQQNQTYEELMSQYAVFRADMNKQLEELDKQEQELVDSLESEETEGQGIWKIL